MHLKSLLKTIVLSWCLVAFSYQAFSQCCAGGGGSPIAGGASQGVLLERQVELNTNYQFISTDKFYKHDSQDTARTFDSYNSSYQYFRLAYGVSKNLTMSVESGYFFEKREVGLNGNPQTTYQSSGIGDLILFPRYDIINWTEEKYKTEVTVGLGYKIPLGSYNDSTGNIEPFSGQTYYVTKPTAVQLSSGAQDLIFYTFLFRGYTEKNLKFFANAFYIKKGWNPNGEKLGDYASVGLFASKSFFDRLGITLQARYEYTGVMKINESILLYGKPSNYYPEATGYKKVFISPQVGYTMGNFTVYGVIDLPVYQYLNTSPYYTQIGSQYQTTVGLSFKFFAKHNIMKNVQTSGNYYCPMHPEEVSDKPGNCSKCGMDLEKAADPEK
jgi:Heavy metal binding domain